VSSRPRCVVCAYSEVGHACLAELLALGLDVALVVTHAPDPGERQWFASVAELAAAAGVPVITPADVNAPEVVEQVAKTRPDLLFSFYFRQMMRGELLGVPRLGALNMHGSLLPRYRGRAPVNWVLVNGEKETGVTLHYMDVKPDHGDVVGQRRVAIDRDDTALTLTRKLAEAARELLREVVPLLAEGRAPRVPQQHRASSYFGGRRPADGEIDWTRDAEGIRNLVRAVTHPWPGAFSHLGGRKVLVWWAETRPGSAAPGALVLGADGTPRVGTGRGLLELVEVAEAGGEPTSGARWAREAELRGGERFERGA
jgi:methionyl-tRNA formyltransferase